MYKWLQEHPEIIARKERKNIKSTSAHCVLGTCRLFPETLTMSYEIFSSLILQMRKLRLTVFTILPNVTQLKFKP